MIFSDVYDHFQKKMRGGKNTSTPEVASLITKLDLILWPLIKFKASDFQSWRLKLPLRDKTEIITTAFLRYAKVDFIHADTHALT